MRVLRLRINAGVRVIRPHTNRCLIGDGTDRLMRKVDRLATVFARDLQRRRLAKLVQPTAANDCGLLITSAEWLPLPDTIWPGFAIFLVFHQDRRRRTTVLQLAVLVVLGQAYLLRGDQPGGQMIRRQTTLGPGHLAANKLAHLFGLNLRVGDARRFRAHFHRYGGGATGRKGQRCKKEKRCFLCGVPNPTATTINCAQSERQTDRRESHHCRETAQDHRQSRRQTRDPFDLSVVPSSPETRLHPKAHRSDQGIR